MATTPYMLMNIPIVSTTLGPAWATQVNAALGQIDSHSHITGQGVPVPSLGINVNGPLPYNNNDAISLRSVRMQDQTNPLTSPADVGCLYLASGNLYFNSGGGAIVQITSGGAVAGAPGSIGGLVSPAAVTYTSGSSTFRFTSNANVNAALDIGSLTIRQPIAAANGITIQSPLALAASYAITLPTALPAGQRFLTIDNLGVLSNWNPDGTTVQVNAGAVGAISVTAIAANTTATIKGNRAAADGGTDVVINSSVARTAGALLDVQNNGVSRVTVDYLGRIIMSVTPIIQAVAANASVSLGGNRVAADAGADVVVVSSVVRTAGNLLDVQNNGVSKAQIDFSGQLWLNGAPNVVGASGSPLTMIGRQAAASAGTDVVVSSQVTRTAGWLFSVQNGGTDLVSVDTSGQIYMRGASGTGLVAFTANAGIALYGNRVAADAGSDVVVTSRVARTAGNLLNIQNNGTTQLVVDFLGRIWGFGTAGAQLISSAANTGLSLYGNRAAADPGDDVFVSSQVTRTAGNLLNVLNNGATTFQVAFNGAIYAIGAQQGLVAGAAGGLQIIGRQAAASASADVQLGTINTRTAGSITDFVNNGVEKATVGFDGNIHAPNEWQQITLSAQQILGASANVVGWTFPVVTGASYEIEIVIRTSGASGPNATVTVGGLAGTYNWCLLTSYPTTSTVAIGEGAAGSALSVWGAAAHGTVTIVHVRAISDAQLAGGTVQIQAANIGIQAGSTMRWHRTDGGGFA